MHHPVWLLPFMRFTNTIFRILVPNWLNLDCPLFWAGWFDFLRFHLGIVLTKLLVHNHLAHYLGANRSILLRIKPSLWWLLILRLINWLGVHVHHLSWVLYQLHHVTLPVQWIRLSDVWDH
jgi:hypothetical protein